MAFHSILSRASFQEVMNITTPPTLSPILTARVPRGQVWLLPHNKRFEMVLVRQTDPILAAATGAETYTVGDFMDVSHLNMLNTVVVWDTDAGAHLTVTDFDTVAGEVTVSDSTLGNDVIAFLPMHTGRVQIALVGNLGFGSLRLPLYNNSVQLMHAVDQWQTSTPNLQLRNFPRTTGLNFGGWVIPEAMQLQVMLDSELSIADSPAAVSYNYYVKIPYHTASVEQMPAGYEKAVYELMVNQGRG